MTIKSCKAAMAGFLPMLMSFFCITPLHEAHTKYLKWEVNGTLKLEVKAFILVGELSEEHM